MTDASEELMDSKIAEAAHAAAISHEATSNLREAQMHETLVSALQEVMTAGEKDNVPLLIRRVPFLCKSVEDIKLSQEKAFISQEKLATSQEQLEKAQESIASDMKWVKWIGMAFVTTGGLLALKSLGL